MRIDPTVTTLLETNNIQVFLSSNFPETIHIEEKADSTIVRIPFADIPALVSALKLDFGKVTKAVCQEPKVSLIARAVEEQPTGSLSSTLNQLCQQHLNTNTWSINNPSAATSLPSGDNHE